MRIYQLVMLSLLTPRLAAVVAEPCPSGPNDQTITGALAELCAANDAVRLGERAEPV